MLPTHFDMFAGAGGLVWEMLEGSWSTEWQTKGRSSGPAYPLADRHPWRGVSRYPLIE
jgi:hypothetical protein